MPGQEEVQKAESEGWTSDLGGPPAHPGIRNNLEVADQIGNRLSSSK